MKKMLLLSAVFCINMQKGFAQKLMQVPDSLAGVCTPQNVSWKMGLKKTHYEFGPYQLSGYKDGTTSWHYEGKDFTLFPKETYSEFKDKSSFIVTKNDADTAFVEVGVLSSLAFDDATNSFFYKGERAYSGGIQTYTALIRSNIDTNVWTLMIQRQELEAIVTIQKPLKGQLVGGGKSFDLKPVDKYENGKSALSGTIGFLIEENKHAMAGVQFCGLPLKLQQQSFVWLPGGTNEQLKFLFATAATAIMVRMHQTLGTTISDAGPPRF